MPPTRDLFCSACGTAFPPPLVYPRTCVNPACGLVLWANPIPVAIALVPVVDGARTGLLVVRRGVPPQIGKLALPGGFMEDHERWQTACAREVVEETEVVVDEASVTLFDVSSSDPRPNRLMVFATTAPVRVDALPAFAPSTESLGRGVVYGPDGLDDEFAFPLHAAAARRWFAERGITGGHDHAER